MVRLRQKHATGYIKERYKTGTTDICDLASIGDNTELFSCILFLA